MIYISSSLYWEAAPLIKAFGLKKNTKIKGFEIFEDNRIKLIITGTGPVKAAASLSFLLSAGVNKEDFFVNIGVCGSKIKEIPLGTPFLCNKIYENYSGRVFYTEMLLKSPFNEEGIESFAHMVYDAKEVTEPLFDMEAAALYQTAKLFFHEHQISFIKIVSDYGDKSIIKGDFIENIVSKNIDKISQWLETLAKANLSPEEMFTKEELNEIIEFSDSMGFTETMKNELLSLMTFYRLKGYEPMDMLKAYRGEKLGEKREGKKIFNEIREKIVK